VIETLGKIACPKADALVVAESCACASLEQTNVKQRAGAKQCSANTFAAPTSRH
jgi:hypothetical protein